MPTPPRPRPTPFIPTSIPLCAGSGQRSELFAPHDAVHGAHEGLEVHSLQLDAVGGLDELDDGGERL